MNTPLQELILRKREAEQEAQTFLECQDCLFQFPVDVRQRSKQKKAHHQDRSGKIKCQKCGSIRVKVVTKNFNWNYRETSREIIRSFQNGR